MDTVRKSIIQLNSGDHPGRQVTALPRLSQWLATGCISGAFVWMVIHPPKLDLLLQTSPVILVHLAGAVIALIIGIILLSGVKGTAVHRRLGWSWVLFMGIAALASLFIRVINPDHFSLIHLLSGWVLIALPISVLAARRRNIRLHARGMTGLFVGGLIIAGLFTFLPGRLMYQVFLG